MQTDLEFLLTHGYKADMIAVMAARPDLFDEALKLAVSHKQPSAWRASWLLWSCMEPNDQRVKPYIPEIVRFLPGCRDNQQREFLKILSVMDIDEEDEGVLFDACAGIWERINKQASARYNAFKTMIRIARKHPSLLQEISFLAQVQYTETLSPGVGRGIKRLLEGLGEPDIAE